MPMKISLTPNASTILELIAGSLTHETGFITGRDIGHFRIVENLIPINFNESAIDEVYSKAYRRLGDKLLGVFFNNRETFSSDWFIENIILKIKSSQPEFYLYGVDHKIHPVDAG